MTSAGDESTSQLSDNMLCLTCGYNLRGLSGDSVCPECATSVLASLNGNQISKSTPAWRKRIATGASITVMMSVAAPVIQMVPYVPYYMSYVWRSNAWLLNYIVLMFRSPSLWMVFYLVTALGEWWICAPEKREVLPSGEMTQRQWARFFILVRLSLHLMLVNLMVLDSPNQRLFWHLSSTIVSAISVWLTNSYVSGVARRIPDFALARNMMTLAWIEIGIVVLGYGCWRVASIELLGSRWDRFYLRMVVDGLISAANIYGAVFIWPRFRRGVLNGKP